MSILEETVHSKDLKRLSWQIANSACRLEKLINLDAPLYIIEKERRILAERVGRLPVTDISGVKE